MRPVSGTPGTLTPAIRIGGAAGVLVLWAPVALLLQSIGGVGTWGDAFMLVGVDGGPTSMVLQKTEAWPVWIAVNTVGAVLYNEVGSSASPRCSMRCHSHGHHGLACVGPPV